MAAFDQQLFIAAPPEFIVASIAANMPTDADLRMVKENALYILFRGETGFVYFLREQPDGKTQLRLLTDSRVFVEQYFREPTLRGAMVKLSAAVPAIPLKPAQIAAYAAHMNRIRQQAESGNIPPPAVKIRPMDAPATAHPPPRPTQYTTFEPKPAENPPPSYAPTGDSSSPPPPGEPPLSSYVDPMQPLKQAKKTRQGLSPIERVLVGLIVLIIGGGLIYGVRQVLNTMGSAFNFPFSTTSSGTANATLSPKAYEDEYIRVNINSPWVREDPSQLPNCRYNAFTTVRFTCYVMVSNDKDNQEMIAVVGGADLPAYLSVKDLPLAELESLTWEEIKKNKETALYKRLEATEITLNGGKDAIRRYYRFPVKDRETAGYGMQIYFYHKGRVFEITVDALSEEIFRKYRPELTKFTTGIQFK